MGLETPFNDLCKQALEHYEKMSQETASYNSLIPRAIKFYEEVYPVVADLQHIAFEISNTIKNIQ